MIVTVAVGHELWRALSFAFGMTWEVLWALILGFALSGAIQALVSKREMRRLMPDDSPKTLVVASGLGAASSSCSYAAVALARSLFVKGADFTAAMAFEISSTNLVIELGIIMWLLLGWQFVLGEFVGGPLLIAGALAAWVPNSFWQQLFFEHHQTLAKFWGPLIGPLVAIVSFVCSIGNVPLAAVLWNGGISFGGVLAFIFADLIILPILDIYRRYYGWRMMWFLLATFYATMATAGLIVEFVFQGAGLVPHGRHAKVEMASISWNYTTVLNIVFLLVAALLLCRYFRRGGGWRMLRMMNQPLNDADEHHH